MLKLERFSFFQDKSTLCIQYENGEQISVGGEHVEYIMGLIKLFDKNKTLRKEDILQSFSSETIKDKNLISELIEWMINSNLIKELNTKKLSKNISVFGNFYDKKNIHKFVTHLGTEQVKYVYKESNFTNDEIKELDIILIVGSGFENFKEILSLNQRLYLENKTLIYIESAKDQITFGPICHRPSETPCLESFFKRKISNDYENFERMSTFSEMPIRKSFKFFDESPLLGLLSEFLKIEINDFVTTKYSSLKGHSFVYNNITKEIYKSEVLKVHNLSYEKSNYINPFS